MRVTLDTHRQYRHYWLGTGLHTDIEYKKHQNDDLLLHLSDVTT